MSLTSRRLYIYPLTLPHGQVNTRMHTKRIREHSIDERRGRSWVVFRCVLSNYSRSRGGLYRMVRRCTITGSGGRGSAHGIRDRVKEGCRWNLSRHEPREIVCAIARENLHSRRERKSRWKWKISESVKGSISAIFSSDQHTSTFAFSIILWYYYLKNFFHFYLLAKDHEAVLWYYNLINFFFSFQIKDILVEPSTLVAVHTVLSNYFLSLLRESEIVNISSARVFYCARPSLSFLGYFFFFFFYPPRAPTSCAPSN